MKIDNKNIHLFFFGILFAPITYYEFSVYIATKQSNINEEWLTTVRIITFIISISYLIFLSKIENIIYNKSLQEDHTNKHHPRIISYIIGIALILSLSIYPLILQKFSLATSMDVLIYSICSMIGIIFWTRCYSNIIIPNMSDQSDEDKSSAIDKHADKKLSKVNFISNYTIILKVLALVFFLLLIIQLNSLFDTENNPDPNFKFKIIPIAFFLFNTVGCITAVFLRKTKSIYAAFATRAISGFLIIWFPLGTGAFIYWYIKVRKREEVE